MHLNRTGTYSATDVLTLSQVKSDLKVEFTDDDTLIQALIDTSIEWVEHQYGIAIASKAWTVKLSEWESDTFIIPLSPVSAVSSVQYEDADGATKTLASTKWSIAGDSKPLRMKFYDFPTLEEKNLTPITITLTAGHATIPSPIKDALRMLVGSMYENRQNEITGSIVSRFKISSEMLLNPYKVKLPA